jgi:DNA processing protein
MGRDLASAGICVVSGLALGIDGAAHAGALSVGKEVVNAHLSAGGPDEADLEDVGVGGVVAGAAGPAGVAASGVDVPYPRRHTGLWERVVSTGVMLAETPPGRPAQAWRFPARNRIIAGLSRMVVVVESHQVGGSLITAEAAIARGIDVRVVPGPVHSPASAGTNQLLHDGPGPVRDACDVLDALGIFLSRSPGRSEGGQSGPAPSRTPKVDGVARRVLDAVLWRPTSLNQVVGRSGLAVPEVSRMLDRLEGAGLVRRDGDWWTRWAKE